MVFIGPRFSRSCCCLTAYCRGLQAVKYLAHVTANGTGRTLLKGSLSLSLSVCVCVCSFFFNTLNASGCQSMVSDYQAVLMGSPIQHQLPSATCH